MVLLHYWFHILRIISYPYLIKQDCLYYFSKFKGRVVPFGMDDDGMEDAVLAKVFPLTCSWFLTL